MILFLWTFNVVFICIGGEFLCLTTIEPDARIPILNLKGE